MLYKLEGILVVQLNNQSDTDMDHYLAQGERIRHSFLTATSKFMAQGGCGRRNTGSKLMNVGKFTTHKGK